METLNVKIEGDVKEVVWREGKAQELPPILAPKSLKITGTISAVSNWLEKRAKDVSLLKSHVVYDLEGGTLVLNVDEQNQINTVIEGKLQFSEVYILLGINEEKFVTTAIMANKLKRLRNFFDDTDIALKTIAALSNFNAKVTRTHASENDYSGNTKKLEQNEMGENTLPPAFLISIPIFKGEEAQSLSCEFEIDPDNMKVAIVSPSAFQKVHDAMQTRISLELDKIKGLSPEIPQIQAISSK